jgi:hypothetical protein
MAATPFTNVAAEDVGSTGDGQRPQAFETACDAAELAKSLASNPWFCTRILEIPNYLEPALTNMSVAMQHGGLEASASANAAVVLTLLTQTPPGQMALLRRHPHLARFFIALDACFAQAPRVVSKCRRRSSQSLAGLHASRQLPRQALNIAVRTYGCGVTLRGGVRGYVQVPGEHQPYALSKHRGLAACARLWANLVSSEAFGHILLARADVPLHEVLVVFCTTSSSPDAGVAAHAVVALFRAVKAAGPKVLLGKHLELVPAIFAGLARGLSCPDAFVGESACAAMGMLLDDRVARAYLFDHAPRVDIENLIAGLAQLMLSPDTSASGIATDAACHFLSGPPGEEFLNRCVSRQGHASVCKRDGSRACARFARQRRREGSILPAKPAGSRLQLRCGIMDERC